MSDILSKAKAARSAFIEISTLTTEEKNRALNRIADKIWQNKEDLIEANQMDLEEAEKAVKKGVINEAIYHRLKFDESKILNVVEMIKSIASLEDPVGKTTYAIELDESLELYRVTSPIGVVGVIFESRPDALPQIASLCLKSSNAVLLKGGSEARNTNQFMFSLIKDATTKSGIPEGWIQLLDTREEVTCLLGLNDYVDLIVPRGSNSFVRYIQNNTLIPVLGHSEGVCHIYIDERADLDKAMEICLDAKVQYPSVCNAVDTLLVHREIAEKFLPIMVDKFNKCRVEVRGCPVTIKIMGDEVKTASDDDWGAEYLDYIVAIKVVDNIDEAIDHVNRCGSHHTDAIITEDHEAAMKFMRRVDSASVIWNASTRFSDGFRYGLGAEVGISTAKIHARGPTGLEGLTIYKYYLKGSGQIVRDYIGKDAKKFTHRPLKKIWK